MIDLVRGRLVATGLDRAVVDVGGAGGGVGLAVLVPPGTVRGRVGDEVALHTHLAVREDALTLYGFPTVADRDLFRTLLGVNGVGPKVALAALGTLGAAGLSQSVLAEDVAAITRVPGIGRKGAQRIVLELRERLGALDGPLPDGAPPTTGSDPRAEVAQALAGLGYDAAEVRATLDKLDESDDSDEAASAEELLRAALRALGAGR